MKRFGMEGRSEHTLKAKYFARQSRASELLLNERKKTANGALVLVAFDSCPL